MDTEKTLGLDPSDIPAADDRDEWDDEEEPLEEPPELYHQDDPGLVNPEEQDGWPLLYDQDGREYIQPPLLGRA
jgi:hypothetical protein